MARFRDLPAMDDDTAAVALASEDWRRRLPDAMRCGGCGAKLGADPLRRVLARLPDQQRLERERGVALGIGDDAAVVHTEAADLIMTIDGFRSLLDDPYLFGRITAHHALNDLLAMGASGIAALAMASVPVMAEAMMEDDLYLLLKGAVEVLNEHAVPLVGGHSAEAHELSLALALTGVRGARLLTKRGLAEGDALVLTKPLGTGALLAAHMRGRLGSDHLAAALASMDRSNAAALAVLTGHDVTALTDVSGFGLLGHLGEMLRACGLGATVTAATVPLLPGARQAVEAGIVSSLQANNEAVLGDFAIDEPAADPRLRLLVDPQTSGGLLAGIPWRRAADCVTALAAAGYGAAVIGRVTAGAARIDLAAAQPMASAGSAP